MSFNLEHAIAQWKKKLRSHQGFEPGQIEELESHLRDYVDDYFEHGLDEKEAFEKALNELGELDDLAEDHYLSRARKGQKISPWKRRSWIPSLLPNYFKVATRNLKRNGVYSFINIFGLAVGLACCLLIAMYVLHELKFDRCHEKSEHIYRVVETRESTGGAAQEFGYTMGPLAPALEQNYPGVKQTVRLVDSRSAFRITIESDQHRFYSDEYLFAEQSFFDVFDFNMIQGNTQNALVKPRSVVLTENAAQTYFGDQSPVGKTLTAGDYGEFIVTGLLENPPKNSHLDFSMLLSFSTIENREEGGWKSWISWWNSWGFITYLVLDDQASVDDIENGLNDLIAQNRSNEKSKRTAFLQPLADIHFGSSSIEFELNAREASIDYLYIFSAIALFIILIACINYMNMATARSARRSKEVGLRKVAGARPSDLIGQFLNESILVTAIACVLAIIFAWFALPYFNELADKDLSLYILLSTEYILGLISIILIIGLLSGSYPAFFLSRFRPSEVLKGGRSGTEGNIRFRHGLVTIQFGMSILMIVATLVVYQQLNYIQDKRLGFNEEQMVVIDINERDVRDRFQVVKNEFKRSSAVKNVTVSSRIPGDWKDITEIEISSKMNNSSLSTAHYLGVDADFLETFQIQLKSGRNFSPEIASDSSAVLLNASAAALFGGKPGQIILHSDDLDEPLEAEVIGIVEDFHFQSLHQEIGPLIIGHHKNSIQSIDYFTARISGENITSTIEYLRSVGEQFDKEHPFEYHFLDQQLDQFYEQERKTAKIFGIAALLTILIASMGMFALSAYMVERRTKEIGIRKTLGASVTDIITLLSTKYLKLVLVGFVIAVPFAWYAMNRWLADFAYRIELSPWVFIVAGLSALLIVVITVSWQSIKAALMNPVKSLRSE